MKEFWQIDCFTVQPFCGNPAAVVFDCDDMDSDWMQAVSREMNLSETVFFLRPSTPDADDRVRFFTPRHELPFASGRDEDLDILAQDSTRKSQTDLRK